MSRNYSIRNFLRHSPNYLLKQYLEASNISLDVDFDNLKETKIEPLFDAIALINDDVSKQINSDFQSIFQMSIEGCVKQILQTARFQGTELEPVFESMKGFAEKAFFTFLNHKEIFETAQKFACTDYLPGKYWRKIKNLKPFIKPDYASKNEILADNISKYFKKVEGRGKSCRVDYDNQANLHYYFCYPEDYSRTELLWEKGNFERRFSSPAFEVIFVYDEDSGTLDSFIGGSGKTDKALKALFAKEVLDIDALPEKEEAVYNLDALKMPGFQFERPVNSKIRKVLIKALRFNTKARKIVSTETKPKESVQAVLDDIKKSRHDICLSSDSIDQVTIMVIMEADNRKDEISRTFNITHPGSCALKYDENDLLIRKMIFDSGLETTTEKEVKVA